MLPRLMRIPALALLLLTEPAAAREREPTLVSFHSGDKARTELDGYVFRPDGKGPFPAVVALHGCSGLFSTIHPDQLSERHRDWAERLVDAGYVVIFPDSFTPRGFDSVCEIRKRRPISPRHRADDARGAANWLTRRSYVDPDRIALLGWSHGGTTALWAARDGARPSRTEFRAAVAFYPACRIFNERAWKPRIPLTILIGAADDWTPAAPCRTLAEKYDDIHLIEYPEAFHGFDTPDRPVRKLTDLAFTASGSDEAHVGTNPAARKAAIKQVSDVFQSAFK